MFPIFSESEIIYRSIRRSVKIVFEMYNTYKGTPINQYGSICDYTLAGSIEK